MGMRSSSSSSSSSSCRKFRAFCKWMKLNGIEYTDALEFITGGASVSEIGVRALAELQKGDLIATIPKCACLTVRTTEVAEVIENEELGGVSGLAVAIMYERSKEESSLWYEYLQILPFQPPVPILWTDEEIDRLLFGTDLHMVVKQDKKFIRQDWKELIKPLCDNKSYGFNPEYFTAEHYFSARALIASRAFQIDEFHGFGMVPLADLFNHKTADEDVHLTSVYDDSDSEPDMMYCDSKQLSSNNMVLQEGKSNDVLQNSKGNVADMMQSLQNNDGEESASHDEYQEETSSVLEMILVKDVSQGLEIFNTYGSLSSAGLLHRYGFTEHEDNPFDIVSIGLDLVMECCSRNFTGRHIRSRVMLWRLSIGKECFEVSFSGKPPVELLMLLFLVHLPDDSFARLRESNGVTEMASSLGWTEKRKGRNSRGGNPNGLESPSQENLQRWLLTREVRDDLVWLSNRRESVYGGASLEEDLRRLELSCPIREWKLYHALSLRISERLVLRRLRDYASERK